jgi:uncharacterized coiled-coil DUF342 family protein
MQRLANKGVYMIEQNVPQREEFAIELRHWQQQYDSHMSAINEASNQSAVLIERIGPKLQQAHEQLDEIHDDIDPNDATMIEFEATLSELREAFKRLERKADAGGPPMA